eukprot:scaffold19009_cov55-Phaeocystis_antarctica.AAC.5
MGARVEVPRLRAVVAAYLLCTYYVLTMYLRAVVAAPRDDLGRRVGGGAHRRGVHLLRVRVRLKVRVRVRVRVRVGVGAGVGVRVGVRVRSAAHRRATLVGRTLVVLALLARTRTSLGGACLLLGLRLDHLGEGEVRGEQGEG